MRLEVFIKLSASPYPFTMLTLTSPGGAEPQPGEAGAGGPHTGAALLPASLFPHQGSSPHWALPSQHRPPERLHPGQGPLRSGHQPHYSASGTKEVGLISDISFIQR